MAFATTVVETLTRRLMGELRLRVTGSQWLGIGLLFACQSAVANTASWQLEVDDAENQIQVHTRKIAENRTEFRGVTRLKTSLSSLVAVLKDVERLPQWAYRTAMAMHIEKISPREAIVYSVAGLSWPFRDRDLIVRTRLAQDPQTLAVTITGEAMPNYLPPDPNYVRVPFLKSSWQFTPAGNGVVEISFRGYGDGGGNLSNTILGWFSQQVVAQAPHETLIGLRRIVRQRRYQQARLEIIREPAASASASIHGSARFIAARTGSE